MPELPEVEHIVHWLRPQLVGKTMHGLEVEKGSERCVPQGSDWLREKLHGRVIEAMERRSKVIFLRTGADRLAIHLKMTGQLWFDPLPSRRPYTRVRLGLREGGTLNLADMRKFGWMQWWDPAAYAAWEAKQGPEPIPALPPGWESRLRSRRSIKAVLLDQAVVAGIGNIFADEILFRARISPRRPAISLRAHEQAALREAVQAEMQAAVDERSGEPDQKRIGGGDRSVKALFHWKVFQCEGEPCTVCATPVERIVVAGRGTYFCPRCQEELEP